MTLLGFENMRWVRGNRSVIFTSSHRDGASGGTEIQTTMTLVDHDSRSAMESSLQASTAGGPAGVTEDELQVGEERGWGGRKRQSPPDSRPRGDLASNGRKGESSLVTL